MEESPLVAPGIRRLTVNIDHEDVALFEGLWPVPNGVALHCYLIEGAPLVLIDPWNAGGYGWEEVGADLEALGRSWADVGAVAFTKAPDAALVALLKAQYPRLQVWGLPQAGATHELGAGSRLEERSGFWFHTGTGVLFTGDAFSGLGWIEEELWTEDLNEQEARYFEDEALRWYAPKPYALAPQPTEAKVVAPAHGCLWRSPSAAWDQVRRFEAWATDGGVDEVTVVWPTGDDEGAEALVGGVLDADAGLNLFRLPGDDLTALTAAARRSGLVVVAEGLDTSFLSGLDKEVWRPASATPAAELRRGLVERWNASA